MARDCWMQVTDRPAVRDSACAITLMVLSIAVLDRKLPSHSVISAIKTLAESESARSGPREPGKAANFGFADPNNRNGG